MFSIRFDLHTNFFFFPSFVYFFSDFCLIFFVVGASAKFMSQWKTLETFVLSTFQHDFWQIQRVQWVEGEKNSTESSLLQFPKVTHVQLGQVYKQIPDIALKINLHFNRWQLAYAHCTFYTIYYSISSQFAHVINSYKK